MSIYTKTGDEGDTGLFGGGRVAKNDIRVTAYGEVDELNAAIGTATALDPRDFEAALLESIQRDLLAVGGQLATPDPAKVAKALDKARLSDDRIKELEDTIDAADRELDPLRAFVLPGGTPKAAALHQARTICRRAERRVVALAREQPVAPVILVYLNRLSDVLFTLARLANQRAGTGDRIW
jgi:cob(I)alamin adenosyltransferase